MQMKDFIKDKILYISLFLVVIIINSIVVFLLSKQPYAVIFLNIIIVSGSTTPLVLEYIKKTQYFKELKKDFEAIENKTLITEIVNAPDFKDGVIFFEILKECNKSFLDNLQKYAVSQEEYKEYIEMWVHEIKTPISALKLLFENNIDSVSKSLIEEVERIENYVEQVLFYARINTAENDYIIKNVCLKDVVYSVIRNNSRNLISKKITFKEENLDSFVLTDTKWCEFIINQIISNSIKYCNNSQNEIFIKAIENKNKINLFIIDNGIGICESDLKKVFEKGFTGKNGRRFSKSTGMGLYICKKLCMKLDLDICIESEENKGTTVMITFSKGNLTKM